MTDHGTLQTIAYDKLLEMIYRGELEYDMIYSETRFTGQLAMSRTPIRDALNRLARERYIEILPSRGFRLHRPDSEDIYNAFHVRCMIEEYCGRYMAREIHRSKAQAAADRMRDALERQMEAEKHASSVDLYDFWTLDREFHHAPLDYMNISAFNSQYDSFIHIFMPQHLNGAFVAERVRSTIREHRLIYESLLSGDETKTQEAIHAHLETSLRLDMISVD